MIKKYSNNSAVGFCLRNFLLLNVFILAGLMMLAATYLIPQSLIYDNAVESAYVLQEEGNYPQIASHVSLDSWTDADYISLTYNQRENIFLSALDGYQATYQNDSTTGVDSLVSYLIKGGKDTELIINTHNYLWNGFRIWLRPMLCLFDVSEIRYIMFLLVFLLFLADCLEIYRLGGKICVIPFIVGILYFQFVLYSLCLSYFSDVSVMLFGCASVIWGIKKNKGEKYFLTLFMFQGALVAFFSMLIYPMITLTIPLLVTFALMDKVGGGHKGEIYFYYQGFSVVVNRLCLHFVLKGSDQPICIEFKWRKRQHY